MLRLAVSLSLLLAGCGARTTLDDVGGDAAVPPPPPPPPMDASPPPPPPLPDARPVPLDAGSPVECGELVVSEPVVVHEALRGSLDAPAVVWRADGLDFGAMHRPAVDGDGQRPRGIRGALRGDAVELTGRVREGGGTSAVARFGALGDLFGGCRVESGAAVFHRWRGEMYELIGMPSPLGGSRCHGVAGDGARWAVLHEQGSPSSPVPVVTFFEPEGPASGGVVLDAMREARPLTIAASGEGVAVATAPDPEGAIAITRFVDARRQSTVRHEGFERFAQVAPGLAPWPGPGPSGQLALAHYALDELVVLRVGARGEELVRVPLSFHMHADIQPAVASAPWGVVVATQSFGDADPTNGVVEVFLLSPGGDVLASMPLAEASRGDDLRIGGISAATASDGSVILHWTENTPRDAGGRTLAVRLTCR
ncbi:MAG: hypothetical protein SangKO_091850 [Sandaracinaceae bacterium]